MGCAARSLSVDGAGPAWAAAGGRVRSTDTAALAVGQEWAAGAGTAAPGVGVPWRCLGSAWAGAEPRGLREAPSCQAKHRRAGTAEGAAGAELGAGVGRGEGPRCCHSPVSPPGTQEGKGPQPRRSAEETPFSYSEEAKSPGGCSWRAPTPSQALPQILKPRPQPSHQDVPCQEQRLQLRKGLCSAPAPAAAVPLCAQTELGRDMPRKGEQEPHGSADQCR